MANLRCAFIRAVESHKEAITAKIRKAYRDKRAGAALLSTDLSRITHGRPILLGYPLTIRAGPSEKVRMMMRESTNSLPGCSRKRTRSNREKRPNSLIGVGIKKLSTSADNTLSLQIGP